LPRDKHPEAPCRSCCMERQLWPASVRHLQRTASVVALPDSVPVKRPIPSDHMDVLCLQISLRRPPARAPYLSDSPTMRSSDTHQSSQARTTLRANLTRGQQVNIDISLCGLSLLVAVRLRPRQRSSSGTFRVAPLRSMFVTGVSGEPGALAFCSGIVLLEGWRCEVGVSKGKTRAESRYLLIGSK
jgi:hypothetical protein